MKNQLNNKKVCSFSEKIAKSYFTFRKNKPNSKNIKIGVSPFKTGKYEILPAWRGKKQTQFKANTNPICQKLIINISSFMTGKYVKFEDLAGKKQSQTNPIFILDSSSPCFTVGGQTQFKLVLECRSRGANFYPGPVPKVRSRKALDSLVCTRYDYQKVCHPTIFGD